MRYDFHIHTREYSACSVSSVEEMCLKAVEAGLAGIALTEHDLWWPSPEIERLQERFSELVILRGMEYSCPDAHFLVFLPKSEKRRLPGWCSALDLIHRVHDHGGIAIWAHPFRFSKTWPHWLDRARPDAMEVASSNMGQWAETMARKLAAEKEIMIFRNSDAHHVSTLGRYGNEWDISLASVDDFINYVRKHADAKTTMRASHAGAAF